LTLKDTREVAKKVIKPANLGWFMAGDSQKVMPGLKELGIEIITIDANGNVVKTEKKG
jgi:hypothetical protein